MMGIDFSWQSALRERVSARRWVESLLASAFISHAELQLQKGDLVVLLLRVSTEQQRSHLKDQERDLRKFARERDLRVVGVFSRVGVAYDFCIQFEKELWSDWIKRAVSFAQKKRAVIIATETNRIIRTQGSGVECLADERIELSDLRRLRQLAEGVTFSTVLHPDASGNEMRSAQTKRGQAKGRKSRGGRPEKPRPGYKVRRRKTWKAVAQQLHDEGKSYRQIARDLGIALGTVYLWIRR